MAKKILAIFIILVCLTSTFSFLSISIGSLAIRSPAFFVDIFSNYPDGSPYTLSNLADEFYHDVATVFAIYGGVTASKMALNGGQLKRWQCHSTLEKGIYCIQAYLRVINGTYPDTNFDLVQGVKYSNLFSLYIDETLTSIDSNNVFIDFYSPPRYSGYWINPMPTYGSWVWKDNFVYRFQVRHNTLGQKYITQSLYEVNNNTFSLVHSETKNFVHYAPYIIAYWDYLSESTYLHIYSTDSSSFEISINGVKMEVTDYIISFDDTVIDLGINP